SDVRTWASRIPLLLFSPNHGLFYWHPLALIALFGIFMLWWKNRELCLWSLILFVLSICVNSIVWEYYGGWSFGARRLTELLPFFAFGLAALWESSAKLLKIGRHITFIAIGWNILLLLQFIGRQIDPAGPLQFPAWLWGQVTGIRFIREAIGQSAVFSNLYYGLTQDSAFYIQSFLTVVLFTTLFLALIFFLSWRERDESYG
ncbi:MAG TPA: hypothetical protein PKL83_07285, partial [bacterium]|nr:hypothetical protein [bacterium]